MAAETTVAVLAEGEYGAWNRMVAESPDGGIYNTPEYLDVLCAAAGGRFRIVAARRGEELAGGVALYERDTAFVTYVSPRLLLYYNGLVLRRYDTKYPSERTSRHLKALAGLEAFLADAGYGHVMLKSCGGVTDVRPFVEAGWTARPSYSYVVPLRDLPGQWARVEQNLRRLVERCAGSGITVSDDDDFTTFYRLHTTMLERRDVGAYLPAAAFEQYFRRLKAQGLCRLFHARLPEGGRPIATQLVLLGAHPVSHTVSAAADPEFAKLGVSAFLRWKVFEILAGLGSTGNDLTDAALNPVTHFKSQLGGDLELSLVLESRPTLAYGAGTGAGRLLRRVRGAAGGLVRRVLRRPA